MVNGWFRLLYFQTQLLLDFARQLQKEVLSWSVPSHRHSQQAALLRLLVESPQHLLGVLRYHQHQIADDPVEGPRRLHYLLSVAALDTQSVLLAVGLLVDIDRERTQGVPEVLLGKANHCFADVDGEVGRLFVFEGHGVGEQQSTSTADLIDVSSGVEP